VNLDQFNPFKNLIDNIFSFPESFLRLIQEKLNGAGTLVAQGININAWLSPVGLLGPTWVTVVKSILLGSSIVLTIWICKRIFALYMEFKQGVKWW